MKKCQKLKKQISIFLHSYHKACLLILPSPCPSTKHTL